MRKTNKTKRILAALLAMIMIMSLLVGCGGKESSKSGNGKTITIGMPKNANVKDYDTNSYTLWLEEQTGYDLEFQYFSSASADYASQVSTMVASGEKLPDILWGMQLQEEAYEMYGEDGFFVDLAPYFEDEELSATFWERMDTIYPEEFQEHCRKSLYDTEDGAIYGFPTIEATRFDTMNHQVFINQKWLDKLGLAMPTDADSLYNVLKAFVTQDPNENGEKDELGLVTMDSIVGSTGGITWLTNMFVNESRHYWWNVDADGQLNFPYTTDEYREALIYIRKLIDEGLMPESVFTMSQTDVKGIANASNGVNKAGVLIGHPTLIFSDGNESLYEYTPLKSWGYVVNTGGTFKKSCFISTDCEDVDAAWEVLMTMCTEEGAIRQRYGEKGVDWEYADEGATSFIGTEARIKVLNDTAWAEGNTLWHAVAGTININAEQESRQVDENDPDISEWNYWKLDVMKQTYDNWNEAEAAKPSTLAPQLIMTDEEEDATQVIRDNCKAWVTSMRAKFACGTENLDPNNDKDWNDYVSKFSTFGFDEWKAQSQEIYDRQIAE